MPLSRDPIKNAFPPPVIEREQFVDSTLLALWGMWVVMAAPFQGSAFILGIITIVLGVIDLILNARTMIIHVKHLDRESSLLRSLRLATGIFCAIAWLAIFWFFMHSDYLASATPFYGMLSIYRSWNTARIFIYKDED